MGALWSIPAAALSPSSSPFTGTAPDPFNRARSIAELIDNPDLSGRIKTTTRLPSYEGTYSDIYKGNYGGIAVRLFSSPQSADIL